MERVRRTTGFSSWNHTADDYYTTEREREWEIRVVPLSLDKSLRDPDKLGTIRGPSLSPDRATQSWRPRNCRLPIVHWKRKAPHTRPPGIKSNLPGNRDCRPSVILIPLRLPIMRGAEGTEHPLIPSYLIHRNPPSVEHRLRIPLITFDPRVFRSKKNSYSISYRFEKSIKYFHNPALNCPRIRYSVPPSLLFQKNPSRICTGCV